MGLRLLVAEGNVESHRERVRALTGRTPSEGYADVLRKLAPDATIDIVFPADPGANIPGAGLEAYDGIAITGSALNVYKPDDACTSQIEFARAAFASKVPFFGSCWGLQVATVAAGGSVRANPKGREVGIARAIRLTEAGRGHGLHDGRPETFDAPCVHMDEVETLAEGMVVTATNAVSDVQAAEITYDGGTFWGVQYHPEYDLTDVAGMLDRYRPILIGEGYLHDEGLLDRMIADYRTLAADPSRRDIAWPWGLDRMITDEAERLAEIRNWIELRVRPVAAERIRGA